MGMVKIMEIAIKLTVDEVNSILGLLGQMPNSSGTYPLLVKIKEQGMEQIKLQSPPLEIAAE